MTKALGLSPAARAQLEKDGVLVAPQAPGYSMAAALYATYTRDLPLLVTTDAILDALHRSFDNVLMDLEERTLLPAVKDALFTAQQKLPAMAAADPSIAEAARDVDLYLTVALNLLDTEPGHTGGLLMAPRLASADDVKAILAKVAKLELENPGINGRSTTVYGTPRAVDWSQFKPRGHYTRSEELTRYFRALMWLGRADTGFELAKPRQLRASAVLTQALNRSGAERRLAVLKDVVDLMVGRADTLSPGEFGGLLSKEGFDRPGALGGDANVKRLGEALAASGLGQQRIRSQLVVSLPTDPKKAELPPVFQLFGQRFILDSFVLSKVVYDDIIYKGQKQERMMPTALDVMAALGNDTAVELLAPELDAWHYATNLATLRDVVASWDEARWSDSLYDLWLGALRTLDDPLTGAGVPEVMKRSPWRKKMLQTQLASWSQLRHDTILYAKQSMTASAGCVYPIGYVEPYVAFWKSLERFGRIGADRFTRLEAAGVPKEHVERYVGWFKNFAKTASMLRGMSEKELAGKPFSTAEERFLKNTIERTDKPGPYMPTPEWDGWYVDLVFQREGIDDVIEFRPEVADVHTDPDGGEALEEATGNTDFLVVAVDNLGDKAIYVGPSFSWYEFRQPAEDRLTDEAWADRIGSGKAPPRPQWMRDLIAP